MITNVGVAWLGAVPAAGASHAAHAAAGGAVSTVSPPRLTRPWIGQLRNEPSFRQMATDPKS